MIRWSDNDKPKVIQGDEKSELAKQGLSAIKSEFKAGEGEGR